jgi:acetyl esterase/lipase
MTLPAIRLVLLLFAALGFGGCAAYGPARTGEIVVRHVDYSSLAGGRELHLDLYRPASGAPLPVIIWFHGGAWSYGHNGYHLLVRNLTSYGFAVASVDYRLLQRKNPWPDQLEDCLAAVDWVKTHGLSYGLNPKRIGLSGESAGGHLAAMVALERRKPEIGAACLMYPPTDLVALARRYERFHRLSVFHLMFHGDIEKRLELAREASPVSHVTRQAPPFVIFHGDRDWLVPLAQSRELDSALKQAGVNSELVVVHGRGHAFTLNREQLVQIAGFFRAYL